MVCDLGCYFEVLKDSVPNRTTSLALYSLRVIISFAIPVVFPVVFLLSVSFSHASSALVDVGQWL